jgi:hypothetical protein
MNKLSSQSQFLRITVTAQALRRPGEIVVMAHAIDTNDARLRANGIRASAVSNLLAPFGLVPTQARPHCSLLPSASGLPITPAWPHDIANSQKGRKSP